MHLLDGRPVYSASDLVGFLLCEHLTDLERAALAGRVKRPVRNDPELELIRKRGYEHERRFRDELVAQGRDVVEVRPDTWDDQPEGGAAQRADDLRVQVERTREAMGSGADVIFQGAFFDGTWRGHADFLLRVDGDGARSKLGPYHYEIADTKLAHSTKASALIQLCTYVDLLEAVQGRQPEFVHVALGGSGRAVERHRVDDYHAYYRALRARFTAAIANRERPDDYPPTASYPDPVEHCDVCRWVAVCIGRWRADDHLSLVAGITRAQRAGLAERGLSTRRALGNLELPLAPPLRRGTKEALARVRDQARIQVVGGELGRTLHELVEPERMPDGSVIPARGLAALPEPSAGDVFFDIEGDPFAFEDGLEYLLGVVELAAAEGTRERAGEPPYRHRWALDRDQEKRAFEWFIDYVVERQKAYPNMHVYHYGAYERGRLARLSTRHATREDEVDALLRGGVLVDLYTVVRQSLRASVESYSIKRLEPLYGFERTVELHAANESIVEFERYLEEGGADPTILDRIRDYNRDDCLSTLLLRDWLESQRLEAERQFGLALPRPTAADGAPSEAISAGQAEVEAVYRRLTEDIPSEGPQTSDQQARQLLANLLDWHRREGKSAWWRFFDLMNRPDDELIEAREPIAGLVFEREVPPPGKVRSRVFRYSFPPQEIELERGTTVHDPRMMEVTSLGQIGRVVTVDPVGGSIEITRSRPALPHPTALVPLERYGTDAHRAALLEIGSWVADHGLRAPGPYRAALDLLLRHAPRRRGDAATDGSLAAGDETGASAALRLVGQLDATTLAIQGPPGSGKSTAGAQMVLRLVGQGSRVGITANSHKVITNLLDKVRHQLESPPGRDSAPAAVQAVQRVNKPGQGEKTSLVELVDDTNRVRDALDAGEAQIGAGTSWLWTTPRMRENGPAVDVLFVDEAGQTSLANALAVSVGARSLVLLGDPQQLDQPMQGAHPEGADQSALAHLLHGAQVMDARRGLFLEHTWRLHPEICRFTSEQFYEGRLETQPGLEAQAVHAPPPLGGSGLRWLPVEHIGNTSRSDEEAAVVAALASSLAEGGHEWTDVPDGRAPVRRPLGWADVLVVAPYNAHVRAIRDALPAAARDRVGTVDKFQGQQAAVAIYSMATSSPDDAPHGMEFLYSLNRLNVATSRAKCLAIVVASPLLVRVRAHTPRQMRLANALCRFIELAQPLTASPAAAAR